MKNKLELLLSHFFLSSAIVLVACFVFVTALSITLKTFFPSLLENKISPEIKPIPEIIAFVRPEHLERMVYQLTVLSLPVIGFFSGFLAERLSKKIKRREFKIIVFIVSILFFALLIGLAVLPSQPNFQKNFEKTLMEAGIEKTFPKNLKEALNERA
ncbi:MAG: hypothetical protein QXH80_00425, partial [Candidatus Nanoarchaeia archaeon]